MRSSILFLAILILCGCNQQNAARTKTIVPTEQVPASVMKAAQTKEPQVKFTKAIKTPDGIYEVQGKNSIGKIIEVEVSEDGKVLKVE
jgi:hypothetical protein